MTLTEAGRARVLDEWARRLTVATDVVRTAGTTLVERAGADAVVVVDLGPARVVLAPGPALVLLRDLDTGQLDDATAVLAQLAPLAPTLIGTATLGYRDGAGVRPEGVVELADDDTVAALLTRCSADERAESGVATMPHRWVVRAADGSPAAIAGHEPWGADVAHLGVVAEPAGRGTGAARVAAGAAVAHALAGGSVVQWRCRVGNAASQRLAGQLGVVPVGRQLAVALEPTR